VAEWTAASIDAAIRATPHGVPELRALRRRISRDLASAPGPEVLAHALAVHESYPAQTRFAHLLIACELLANHPAALALVAEPEVRRLGSTLSEWSHVDILATQVSGRCWREGQIADAAVEAWAASEDRWWRRMALVSTVSLNVRAQGGRGDAPRTLRICGLLVDDRDDTVVKALSWALRALIEWDRAAVEAFLDLHRPRLAARVVREVRRKLDTGLKNRRRAGRT
jgi:3-methyladenine DNA glycosylase AlkD